MHHTLIIGCGSIGKRHLRCFLKTGRTQATACDMNEALLKEIGDEFNVPTTTDWQKALADPAIDAVVVCTPAHLHVRMAQEIMRAGKHVLIEKPFSTSLDGTDDLISLRDETGLNAYIAYVQRYNPPIYKACEFFRTGKFGKALQATVVAGQDFAFYRPGYQNTYYKDHKMGGGAIQDALTHTVNAVEWIVGSTEKLVCDALHQAIPGVEVEDTVTVIGRNGSAQTMFCLNQWQAPNEIVIQINAEHGSVRMELARKRWSTLARGEEDWTHYNEGLQERDEQFISQATAFLDAVDGKTPSPQLCTLEEGLQTLKFNLGALESVETGQWVNLA